MSMIGAPVHRIMRNTTYASSIFNRALNRASCFENTLTILNDPKHNRQLFLVGTTNSSTLLAERTRELIRKEKPDTVFVQTNSQWWNIAKELKGVNTQAEFNNYTNLLRNTQEWDAENGPRALIFKFRFYTWLFSMFHFTGLPSDFRPFTAGLEMKYAVEEALRNNSNLIFGGHEINHQAFNALRNEKRMDLLPLFYRWFTSLDNARWKSEHHDNNRLLETLGGENFAEIVDKYRVNWFIKWFEKVSPLQKRILIDQRDVDLFYGIYRDAPGKKIVAVVNQWHTPGIEAHWRHSTGTEIKGEPINPVGDMDIEGWMRHNAINDALRDFTSKLTKSEPADTENYLLMYHKKTMEAERSRNVHFLGHDDPHMPGNSGGHGHH